MGPLDWASVVLGLLYLLAMYLLWRRIPRLGLVSVAVCIVCVGVGLVLRRHGVLVVQRFQEHSSGCPEGTSPDTTGVLVALMVGLAANIHAFVLALRAQVRWATLVLGMTLLAFLAIMGLNWVLSNFCLTF